MTEVFEEAQADKSPLHFCSRARGCEGNEQPDRLTGVALKGSDQVVDRADILSTLR